MAPVGLRESFLAIASENITKLAPELANLLKAPPEPDHLTNDPDMLIYNLQSGQATRGIRSIR